MAALKSILIEPGVKVNGAYYRNNLLAKKLLPDLFQTSQGGIFVVQQDGATGASSTIHRRFPGAKGARLYSTNTVAADLTGSDNRSNVASGGECSISRRMLPDPE